MKICPVCAKHSIAAIAIPNLVRSKMAANEAGAAESLRSYDLALAAYLRNCPQVGFPPIAGVPRAGRG
jgi:hypothetical protein